MILPGTSPPAVLYRGLQRRRLKKAMKVATLRLNEKSSLKLLDEKDAEALFLLTEKNRIRLRQWLPWLDRVQQISDSEIFVRTQLENARRKQAMAFGLFVNGQLSGVVGFNEITLSDSSAEIGYWLDKDHQGQGLMTLAVRALIDYGFSELKLRKIIIRCASENYGSQGIPKRLGSRTQKISRSAKTSTADSLTTLFLS